MASAAPTGRECAGGGLDGAAGSAKATRKRVPFAGGVAGAAAKVSAMIALAVAVPSAPQAGQFTTAGSAPSTGSASNA
jgi:hypothetical protein